MVRLIAALLGALIILVGCTANENSIFRTYDSTANRIALIDAKQRAILSNKVVPLSGVHRNATVYTRYCAEPSPDVFSVLSSALSVSGTFSNPAGTEAGAQLARSVSESGASIGLRTQTIQVLRDMMYRLCERYMNGAIDDDEFAIQAARDQRIIVSIMAIEQLTGAVQPRPVIIHATSEADAGANIGQLQMLLDDARNELDQAKEEESKAKEAQKSAADAKKAADDALAADPDNADKKAAAQRAAKDLEAADSALAKATQKVSDREKNLAAISDQIERARYVAARGSGGGYVAPETIEPETAKEVADTVEMIVALTFDIDEVTLTCLKSLVKENGAVSTQEAAQAPALSFCLRYLERQEVEEEAKTEEARKALDLLRKMSPTDLYEGQS